ncbi:hypothetical protein V2S84_01205 [Azotobacter chroococcum]|nr:hypothetical protein [Azotobacter chroococcum]
MSAAYPKIARIRDEMDRLQKELKREMAEQFINRRVRVNHHRGSYTGVVSQVSYDGLYVIVSNDATGKATARYPLSTKHGRPEIELIDDGGDA